jgi:hypothetical protein
VPEKTYGDKGQIDLRCIKTRVGHELLFDDSNSLGEVKVTTNKGHTLTLNDKDNKIQAKTTNGHELTLDDSGNNNTLKDAGGNQIEIDSSSQSISIHAIAKVEIKAAMIDIEASGVTTIKGSVVNINT